jgi:hypothetical protein
MYIMPHPIRTIMLYKSAYKKHNIDLYYRLIYKLYYIIYALHIDLDEPKKFR